MGFSDAQVTDERPYARLAPSNLVPIIMRPPSMPLNSRNSCPIIFGIWKNLSANLQRVALYYVSKFAKNFVKVLISGEGGR